MQTYQDFQQWQHCVSIALFTASVVLIGLSMLGRWFIHRYSPSQTVHVLKYRPLGYYPTNTVANYEIER
jgi:hypothetical protein